MRSVVFVFQVHQPFRLRRYTFFDIGHRHDYFDDSENARILRRVAEKCYLPMNGLVQRLIERTNGAFRCAYSITGTALDQMASWAPEVVASFQSLAKTDAVEFLAETSHHSLAYFGDVDEFDAQVRNHAARIEQLFGRRPTVFRNTELIVDNQIARRAEELGFLGILGEGADQLLGWRSAHRVYRPEACERIKILLRSYRLSDDIAFRFSNRNWSEWPLTADRFASWIHALPEKDDVVGLFMDYETFGEHQWADTGIFEFMDHLPEAVLAAPDVGFRTPSEVLADTDPVARLDIPHPISWADTERDLTAWLGNPMQQAAHKELYRVGREIRESGDMEHLEIWRKLSTSDHLYYMCTKWFADGDVHKYFNPYNNPHDAFIVMMNVLEDIGQCCRRRANVMAAAS